MDFESYLTAVGAIAGILATLVGIFLLVIQGRKQEDKQVAKSRMSAPAKSFLGALVVLIVILIVGIALFPVTPASDQNTSQVVTKNTTQTSVAVKITTPADNSTVRMNQSVNGIAQNVPTNRSLWVVIYSPDTLSYYPQKGPINISESGLWSGQAYIGNNNDSRKQFEILAISANDSVNAFLTNYLERGRPTGNYPAIPLEEFPKVNVVDQIVVIRE